MLFRENRKRERNRDKMNVIILLVAFVGGIVGGVSTIYLIVSLIGVIVWKIYRRIAKGIPLTK